MVCPMQKRTARKKSCEIQGGGPEVAVMVCKIMAKLLITTIQAILLPPPNFTRNWHQIDLNGCY